MKPRDWMSFVHCAFVGLAVAFAICMWTLLVWRTADLALAVGR